MEEAKNVKSSYTILRSAFAKLFCVELCDDSMFKSKEGLGHSWEIW
jgi:hypothetical protein